MRTPAQLAALTAASQSWSGTPFCERSAVKGAGVCCHRLVFEVLVEAGWLPRVEVPDGPAHWSRAGDRSLIAEWMDGPGQEWFITLDSVDVAQTEPGDIAGCRLGRTLHHLALRIPAGWCHAVHPLGVVIAPEIPRTWLRRVERIWRLR